MGNSKAQNTWPYMVRNLSLSSCDLKLRVGLYINVIYTHTHTHTHTHLPTQEK